MSMNIVLTAHRKVIVVKTGEEEWQRRRIELWQTPTKVTYAIIESENPKQAYFDWMLSVTQEVSVPIYAPEDILNEGAAIGYKEEHYGKEHIKRVEDEMAYLEERGYEFEWSGM